MRNFLLGGLLLGFLAATASASVTYQTSGVFNCTNNSPTFTGCGTDALDLDTAGGNPDIILAFDGVLSNTVTPTTGGPFGDIVVECADGTTGGAADCGPETLPAGVTLTITIDQTSPSFSPAALSVNATLTSGTITGTSTGGVAVVWSTASTVTFGSDLYSIGPTNDPLNPPSSGGPNFGSLTLNGLITNESLPEPSTLSLMGAGLIALGFAARRKRA